MSRRRPPPLQRDEAYFWLTVTGDSMEPILCEGDLVLVRKQTSVDNGSMAVVLVGGEEGLVKKKSSTAGLDRTAQPQSRLCRAAL